MTRKATAETAEHAEKKWLSDLCALRGCFLLAFVTLASLTYGQNTGPVIVIQTVKGTFEIETYATDAPKTVAHVVALVEKGFYDGQRVHRAVTGFIVQWGDPRSRNPGQDAEWGRGAAASSGTPIGVAEMNKKRLLTRGAVAMAHQGDPSRADSQMFVTLADRPDLNNRYAVFGRVIAGDDVPGRLERGDLITRVYVKR